MPHAAPQPCDLLLLARFVLTQDAERTVHADGAVAVRHGRVLAAGPAKTLQNRFAPAQTLHLGESCILPGLINAHTHASMTLLRGLADDLPLMTWLTEHIFPREQRLTPELVELGALLACAEMTRHGVTAFCDMYLMEEGVCKAADAAGLRVLAGEVLFAFPSPAYADEDAAFALVRQQAAQWQGHERIRLALMPHAVYTTTPALLERCRDFALELDLPLHLHLSETATETSSCVEAHGLRPVAYCDSLGLLGRHTTIAHAVDLTPEELDILAARGCVVAHCPRSNMKLASGVAPVPGMLERGIPVGLGTDGAASSNNLNLFAEMSAAALLHKVHALDPTAMPAQSALDLATRGGAAALHQPELGRLEPGLPADLIAIDLTSPNLVPLHNPVSNLVYAATGQEVRLTMVAGEVLYQDGVFTRLDLPAILATARTAAEGLRKG